MKNIVFTKRAMVILTIVWFAYNSHFGWNLEPINKTEELWDKIISLGFSVAFMIYLYPTSKALRADCKKERK